MKKKILIVGGTGFIGYHFAKKCIANKLEVTSLSRSKPKKIRYLKEVKYIFSDIVDKKNLKLQLTDNYNYVINLGGDVDHHGKRTFKSHYNGCKNLVSIFKKKKIERFIQVGSSVEYGKLKSPHKENATFNFFKSVKSNYAKAKLKSSIYLLNIYKKERFPVTIFRIYLTYGPAQDNNRVIPFTIQNCLKKKKFPCSDGEQLRDFIYINDVIDIMFKSLKKKNSIGEIFNICSGKPTNIKDLINLIKNNVKSGKPQFGLIDLRKDEEKIFFGSLEKTKKFFRWEPKVNLKKGISKTIRYYENNFKKKV